MLGAIILSNLLDSALPKLPLPIIQIALGVAIALTPINVEIHLEPEVFMGILIAPILFREAEEADLFALWKLRKSVVFLVFGLVFLTVFGIGFALNLFDPSIPLAACFALGAILGPTDAIAVNAVAGRVAIPKDVMTALKGEWLINDATGVISFNFAALALVTGAFSVLNASLEFIALCLGGVLVGLILGFLKSQSLKFLNRYGIRNTAAFMLLEILMPFVCFYAAEALGFSGIIAAVTAGSRQAFSVRNLEIFEAEFAQFKKSMWEMVNVSFNSFIFLLLGLQLPSIYMSVAGNPQYTVPYAARIGAITTLVLFGVRLVGTFFAVQDFSDEESSRIEKFRSWMILTLSGVKGTVSLATAFALPMFLADGEVFIQRDILLLITAFSILYSLIISSIALPLIAKPAQKTDEKVQIHSSILHDVVEEMEMSEDISAESVIINIKKRIRSMEDAETRAEEKTRYIKMREEFFEEEKKMSDRQLKNGDVSIVEYIAYSEMAVMINEMQRGSPFHRIRRKLTLNVKKFRTTPLEKMRSYGEKVDVSKLQTMFWENTSAVIGIMEARYGVEYERILSRLLEERLDNTNRIMERAFGDTEHVAHLRSEYERELLKSFELERKYLSRYQSAGLIDDNDADEIRKEINTLENFAIEEIYSDASIKMIAYRARFNRMRTRRLIKNLDNKMRTKGLMKKPNSSEED